MKLGIGAVGFGPKLNIDLERIRFAEKLGYDTAWTAEAYGNDAVSTAAWVLANTTRLKVGTAIMQMPARTPAMAAMTEATIGGRAGAPMPTLLRADGAPVEWAVSGGLVDYEEAVAAMEARVAAIAAGIAPEQVWLLEHPPLYTAGTSARPVTENPPHSTVSERPGSAVAPRPAASDVGAGAAARRARSTGAATGRCWISSTVSPGPSTWMVRATVAGPDPDTDVPSEGSPGIARPRSASTASSSSTRSASFR